MQLFWRAQYRRRACVFALMLCIVEFISRIRYKTGILLFSAGGTFSSFGIQNIIRAYNLGSKSMSPSGISLHSSLGLDTLGVAIK